MKTITQKLVKEVKRSNSCGWHDEDWHAFQRLPEVEAINFALETLEHRPSLAEIVEEAKAYLAAQA